MRTHPVLRLSPIIVIRALLALCVVTYALLLANLGCSSGAVCYRQTDCPSGTSCKSGACVRPIALGDGGIAGASNDDAGVVSTAGTAGGDGTSTAGADGIAGGT